ncbi:MFS general substrate transporter [Cantharellus anzutake]|uniref:MFS general substrate transporter n=1 Tax=Cantharellus anzutake TaxID=1750568 RepID=UPI0019035D1F|nr:MFS general substrate transporter [Cantharellus anzutake]KAF8331505.1 MFS general substrate transporter [Cantharellus anzutake]
MSPRSSKINEVTGTQDSYFLVTWDCEDDPENPYNWAFSKRCYVTVLAAMLVLNAAFASSATSGVSESIGKSLGFSPSVGGLLISLFVAGYCVGPLLWGPLSEAYGRRPILVLSFAGLFGSQIGCALSRNKATLFSFRFLAGCFAASPFSTSGAIMTDLWQPYDRGHAMAAFAAVPFGGQTLGPIVSGLVEASSSSWRWVFWILSFVSGASLVLILISIPETYGPRILELKARRLRMETGNARWLTSKGLNDTPFGTRVGGILLKPWRMFFQEPVLIAINAYVAFCTGLIYLLFGAYPIVFGVGHGFDATKTGLMFIPVFVGGGFSCLAVALYFNPLYIRATRIRAPLQVPPEERLPMGMIGSVLLTVSLFWFGWTSVPSISFWAPASAGTLLAFSLTLIFLSLINYIADVYTEVAASALATNTVCRSLVAAAFPLFATKMYTSLEPKWASTILGCIALLFMPMPLLFMRYGPYLRSKSRYSPSNRSP